MTKEKKNEIPIPPSVGNWRIFLRNMKMIQGEVKAIYDNAIYMTTTANEELVIPRDSIALVMEGLETTQKEEPTEKK